MTRTQRLRNWLNDVLVTHNLTISHIAYFHKRLMAIDKKNNVLIYLEQTSMGEKGHLIGIQEIADCELIIDKSTSQSGKKYYDTIALQIHLNNKSKAILLPLYKRNIFQPFNQKMQQLYAIRWYKKVISLCNENSVSSYSQIA